MSPCRETLVFHESMRPAQCVTAIHIDVWHQRVLPRDTTPVTFWMVLRGSLLPIMIWTGVGCIVYFAFDATAAMALGGLFIFFVLVGSGLRRRAKHSVRCSLYGAIAGVFTMSADGF